VRAKHTTIAILLKNCRSSFENLRMNGGAVVIGDSPFMLSIVEAFLGFVENRNPLSSIFNPQRHPN
jgi:hypothetical protein